jgi:chorismate mutase/prephenate dehydratase
MSHLPDEPPMPSLAELRERIDLVDRQIQALLSERASYARQVGIAKGPMKEAVDYYRPEREAQVLRAIVDRNRGPLSDEELLRVFREIMSSCLAQQNPLKIAYLGPEGTFSQQAVQRHFGHSVVAIPMGSLEEVFTEVEAHHADFGVVPVENSSEGSVHHTLDMFLTTPLRICGEIELRVHQSLLSRTTDLTRIERVYSHAQSLGQCRSWLRRNLPDAERIAVASNAEAARRARDAEGAAAIAGTAAAHVYGLSVLASGIEDRPDNTTRFLVIGRELFSPSGHDKTSLVLATRDRPGALYALLTPLAERGISMTRIESRPDRTARWEYVFFVDVEGHISDPRLAEALAALGPTAAQLRVLGSYPAAIV